MIATNSPIVDRYALHTKMAPYRTYAMAFSIKTGALPDALYWDTEDPYHYVRLQPGARGKDYVIVGGEDHKTGEADDGEQRFGRLEDWARELIPALENITHRWSGQVLDTIDYAGFIGRNPGNEQVYVATGEFRPGPDPWRRRRAHQRRPDHAGQAASGRTCMRRTASPSRRIGNYLRENVTALKNLAEYRHAGRNRLARRTEDRPGRDPASGPEQDRGLSQRRAARCSCTRPSCTHIGCQLHFNSFEHTWDCPCHGSIFDVDGQPLNAPAVSPLQPRRALPPEPRNRQQSLEHS